MIPERIDQPGYLTGARDLTANETASLEKIAALRGHIGKLRAQIVMAHDVLHGALIGVSAIEGMTRMVNAHTILSKALELQAPEAP